jgi:hypothetical protein
MTTEEFNEKFKVGDKITSYAWNKNEFAQITCIGIKHFEGVDEKGNYFTWEIGCYDWQPYQERKEQDLKDVFPYFIVRKHTTGSVELTICFGNDIEFQEDNGLFSVITLQEAEERGLDLTPLLSYAMKFNLKN